MQERQYQVVINAQHQYSVWLAQQPLPGGWLAVGFIDTRQRCLEHIGELWTDLRELSLQLALADTGAAHG